ncbi:MAG: oligosaccharide flippase family protein [Chloroflexales bacterium]
MNNLFSQLKFLLKDTLLYGMSSIALRFIALITTPIVTRMLITADYGVVDAVTVLSYILAWFTLFGQDSAIVRYYYETEDSNVRRQIVSTGFWFSTVIAILATLVLLLTADIVSRAWLGIDAGNTYRLMAISLPFTVVNQHFIGLLKWTFRRIRYFIFSLGTALFTLSGIVLFVRVLGFGASGVFMAQIMAQSIATILGIIFCRDLITLPSASLHLRRLLKFGWPFMVIAVGSFLITALDRVFVSRYLSIEDLGVYAAGSKAAALMALVTGGFQVAWGPFAFSRFKDPDAPHTFSVVLSLYTAAMLTLAIVLSTYSGPILTLLASSRYVAGQAVIGILALGLAINGIQWITGIGIAVAERTYLTALAYAIGMTIGIGMYPLLIPVLGMIGAALGTLIMQTLMTLLVTFFAQKVHPYPYEFKTILIMLAITALCIAWQTSAALPANLMDWIIRTAGGLSSISLIGALIAYRYAKAIRIKLRKTVPL